MTLSDELLEAWAIEFQNAETPAGNPYYMYMSFAAFVAMKQRALERGDAIG
ncbi:hypothetical protein [Salibacterium lacus]|uniref:Uncharacterized protein n=1 Tax=Salibacterium lacus TaxID=1898109 RepID=A0ABW5T2S0_9BACI